VFAAAHTLLLRTQISTPKFTNNSQKLTISVTVKVHKFIYLFVVYLIRQSVAEAVLCQRVGLSVNNKLERISKKVVALVLSQGGQYRICGGKKMPVG
jgi:hypothetical protein